MSRDTIKRLEDFEKEIEQLEAIQRMYLRRYLHMLASDDPMARCDALKTIMELNELQKIGNEVFGWERPTMVDQISEMVEASQKMEDLDFWTTG